MIKQLALLGALLSTPLLASAQLKKCTPVDQHGIACISIIDNGSRPRSDGGTTWFIKFQNSCNDTFSVKAQRNMYTPPDDGVSGGGIAPGRTMELTCIDSISANQKCAGFGSWWAMCK